MKNAKEKHPNKIEKQYSEFMNEEYNNRITSCFRNVLYNKIIIGNGCLIFGNIILTTFLVGTFTVLISVNIQY